MEPFPLEIMRQFTDLHTYRLLGKSYERDVPKTSREFREEQRLLKRKCDELIYADEVLDYLSLEGDRSIEYFVHRHDPDNIYETLYRIDKISDRYYQKIIFEFIEEEYGYVERPASKSFRTSPIDLSQSVEVNLEDVDFNTAKFDVVTQFFIRIMRGCPIKFAIQSTMWSIAVQSLALLTYSAYNFYLDSSIQLLKSIFNENDEDTRQNIPTISQDFPPWKDIAILEIEGYESIEITEDEYYDHIRINDFLDISQDSIKGKRGEIVQLLKRIEYEKPDLIKFYRYI